MFEAEALIEEEAMQAEAMPEMLKTAKIEDVQSLKPSVKSSVPSKRDDYRSQLAALLADGLIDREKIQERGQIFAKLHEVMQDFCEGLGELENNGEIVGPACPIGEDGKICQMAHNVQSLVSALNEGELVDVQPEDIEAWIEEMLEASDKLGEDAKDQVDALMQMLLDMQQQLMQQNGKAEQTLDLEKLPEGLQKQLSMLLLALEQQGMIESSLRESLEVLLQEMSQELGTDVAEVIDFETGEKIMPELDGQDSDQQLLLMQLQQMMDSLQQLPETDVLLEQLQLLQQQFTQDVEASDRDVHDMESMLEHERLLDQQNTRTAEDLSLQQLRDVFELTETLDILPADEMETFNEQLQFIEEMDGENASQADVQQYQQDLIEELTADFQDALDVVPADIMAEVPAADLEQLDALLEDLDVTMTSDEVMREAQKIATEMAQDSGQQFVEVEGIADVKIEAVDVQQPANDGGDRSAEFEQAEASQTVADIQPIEAEAVGEIQQGAMVADAQTVTVEQAVDTQTTEPLEAQAVEGAEAQDVESQAESREQDIVQEPVQEAEIIEIADLQAEALEESPAPEATAAEPVPQEPAVAVEQLEAIQEAIGDQPVADAAQMEPPVVEVTQMSGPEPVQDALHEPVVEAAAPEISTPQIEKAIQGYEVTMTENGVSVVEVPVSSDLDAVKDANDSVAAAETVESQVSADSLGGGQKDAAAKFYDGISYGQPSSGSKYFTEGPTIADPTPTSGRGNGPRGDEVEPGRCKGCKDRSCDQCPLTNSSGLSGNATLDSYISESDNSGGVVANIKGALGRFIGQ